LIVLSVPHLSLCMYIGEVDRMCGQMTLATPGALSGSAWYKASEDLTRSKNVQTLS